MKTKTRWAITAALVPAVVFGLLTLFLFYTRLGDGMPDGVKVGMPVLMYVAYVAFLVTHRKG